MHLEEIIYKFADGVKNHIVDSRGKILQLQNDIDPIMQ